MKLDVVMEEIADQLRTIPGLWVQGFPAKHIKPPAAVVAYPEEIVFDSTYARGMDTMNPAVMLYVGDPYDRTTRSNLAGFVDGSGPKSIKRVIESGSYTEADDVHVRNCIIDGVRVGQVDYIVAQFNLEIAGSGA